MSTAARGRRHTQQTQTPLARAASFGLTLQQHSAHDSHRIITNNTLHYYYYYYCVPLDVCVCVCVRSAFLSVRAALVFVINLIQKHTHTHQDDDNDSVDDF